MSDLFFDTSGLAKRYIAETGSSWVKSICLPSSGNFISIAGITVVEMTAAITRRKRGGSLTAADAAIALAQFDVDLSNEYFVLEITPALLTEARDFAENYGLRGYDAVQLAAAVVFNRQQTAFGLPTITLVTADIELFNAARAEGLNVENPNNYP